MQVFFTLKLEFMKLLNMLYF